MRPVSLAWRLYQEMRLSRWVRAVIPGRGSWLNSVSKVPLSRREAGPLSSGSGLWCVKMIRRRKRRMEVEGRMLLPVRFAPSRMPFSILEDTLHITF